MTREEAVIILDGFKNNPLFNSTHIRALDMAISALSEDGEYVKKGDAISKILIEFTERESNGKVMCACADVKQTCADILDGLPSYSFPDSENKGEWIYQQGIVPYKWRCNKCEKMFKTDFNYCPNCGADMRGET